jgi:hypothetical protein
VAALNMLRDRIPRLVHELNQVHQALPKMLVEVLTGDMSHQAWLALAALCDEPGQILIDLGHLCHEQAESIDSG